MYPVSLIAAFSRCATFEIENGACYAPACPVRILLNGKDQGEFQKNVFTLFGLKPEMYYELRASDETGEIRLSFVTPKETGCCNITSFGAASGGEKDCTGAIQAAIAACPPGGTVLIPAGTYRTYPLFLKSDMTLYLEKGAVLLAGTQRNSYPILPGMLRDDNGKDLVNLGTWEGNPLDCYASLITAISAERLVIAGEGVLDGDAQNADWWVDAKKRRGAWRPRLVFLNNCTGVTLAGISLRNSPSWTLHPYCCCGVDILDISIQNPYNSPNTDGCNPESCENVRIIGAFISVGDDCISVKSGKYYMAKYHPRPSRNTLVRNCLLDRGHGAVVVGSEISAGVENLKVEQCVMRDTDRGLRVKTRRGRGDHSVVTGIEYSHIEMQRVKTAFVINMFYFCDPDGRTPYVACKDPLPVTDETPRVGTLYCHDIVCDGCEIAGGFFYGLPEMPVDSVRMENVTVRFSPEARPGMAAMMSGLEPMRRTALFAVNLRELVLHNVRFEGQEGETVQGWNVETMEASERGTQ